jgi:hypothetical protein
MVSGSWDRLGFQSFGSASRAKEKAAWQEEDEWLDDLFHVDVLEWSNNNMSVSGM